VLSVVIPIYNEEKSIPELHSELSGVLATLGQPYEVVYVDDGSRDDSFKELERIAADDDHVVVIQFRRNFGQTAALAAGMDAAQGDVLVFMDGDLQNDPTEIPRMLQTMEEGKFDVVSGWRFPRHDNAISRKLPSQIANWIIGKVSGVRLHDYGCTLKAYRRDVLENVRLYGEMHRFIPAYAAWSGASITELKVRHRARQYGKSKYGIGRTVKVVLDLLTLKFLFSYGTKPAYLFGGLGFACWGLGILTFISAVVERISYGTRINRNPIFMIGLILGVMGLQFILMGLLAELMIRIYHESQGRRTYAVREVRGARAERLKPVRRKAEYLDRVGAAPLGGEPE